jgi:hypothetical protein
MASISSFTDRQSVSAQMNHRCFSTDGNRTWVTKIVKEPEYTACNRFWLMLKDRYGRPPLRFFGCARDSRMAALSTTPYRTLGSSTFGPLTDHP